MQYKAMGYVSPWRLPLKWGYCSNSTLSCAKNREERWRRGVLTTGIVSFGTPCWSQLPDAPLARFIILPVTADFVYTRGRVIITWNVQILYASENYAPPPPYLACCCRLSRWTTRLLNYHCGRLHWLCRLADIGGRRRSWNYRGSLLLLVSRFGVALVRWFAPGKLEKSIRQESIRLQNVIVTYDAFQSFHHFARSSTRGSLRVCGKFFSSVELAFCRITGKLRPDQWRRGASKDAFFSSLSYALLFQGYSLLLIWSAICVLDTYLWRQ